MSSKVALVLCLSFGTAFPSSIGLYDGRVRADVRPHIVGSGNIDAVPPGPNYRTPIGAGYDGVAGLILNTAGGSGLCSGALLSSGQHVITAAHCLTDEFGNNTLLGGSAIFFPNPSETEAIQITGVSIHNRWTGNLLGGNDLAIVSLAGSASMALPRYDLYTGADEISKTYNVVGFGARGSFGEGITLPAGSRRQGKNTFDASLGDIGFGSDSILLSDFDSGALANDGFSFFFGFAPHLGLGFDEVLTAPGDSGGPSFIDGKLAGINSFGLTLSFPGGLSSDISPGVLNASWGEFDGTTRLSSHVQWINGPHQFLLIPEPSSGILCLIGLVCARMLHRRAGKTP